MITNSFFILLIVGEYSFVHLDGDKRLWATDDHKECLEEVERLAPMFPAHEIKILAVTTPPGLSYEEALRDMLDKWHELLAKGRAHILNSGETP